MCMHIRAFMNMYMHIYVHTQYTCANTCSCMHVRVHAHVYLQACVHTYVCTFSLTSQPKAQLASIAPVTAPVSIVTSPRRSQVGKKVSMVGASTKIEK